TENLVVPAHLSTPAPTLLKVDPGQVGRLFAIGVSKLCDHNSRYTVHGDVQFVDHWGPGFLHWKKVLGLFHASLHKKQLPQDLKEPTIFHYLLNRRGSPCSVLD